jgi:DNA-binding LacI/PurR family transcriptional regulator
MLEEMKSIAMIGIDAVAKLAGVSAATASRALSKPEMVAKATRERVMRAARELNYQPNVLARGLRQRGSRTLGVIISDLLNPGNAMMAKGAQDAAAKRDYTVFMFNTDEEADKERRALESLRGHLPQGLIIMPTAGARQNLKLVPNLPTVELDRVSGLRDAHTVLVDNVGGARTAVQHLLDLGHTRIGMIVGTLDISTAVERLQGYREALEAAGVPYRDDLVLIGNHREDGGHAAAHELLSRPTHIRPTALFVGNNEMTIGALLALREQQLRIPEDLSIVGFDDSRWARLMQPAITVVAQPGYELAHLACETLLNRLERGSIQRPANVRLSTTFIRRASTTVPRADT